MESDIKVLEVTIDAAHASAGVKKEIIPALMPEWGKAKISETKLPSGQSNPQMKMYRLASDEDLEEAIVVRVFGEHPERAKWLGCRESEVIAMQLGNAAGCFPSLLAIFKNGVVHEYAAGKCLEGWELTNSTVSKRIATALANFHWEDPTVIPLISMQGEPATIAPETPIFRQLRVLLEHFEKNSPEVQSALSKLPPVGDIGKEVDFLDGYLDGLDLPRANCHMDFHGGNIIFDPRRGGINFVDYEFSGTNIAVYDFASLFSSYLTKDLLPGFPAMDERISDDQLTVWVTTYLRRKDEIQGLNPNAVNEHAIDMWVLSTRIMEIVYALIAGVVTMSKIPSGVPKQAPEVSERLFNFYFEHKSDLSDLRNDYLAAKSKTRSSSSGSKMAVTTRAAPAIPLPRYTPSSPISPTAPTQMSWSPPHTSPISTSPPQHSPLSKSPPSGSPLAKSPPRGSPLSKSPPNDSPPAETGAIKSPASRQSSSGSARDRGSTSSTHSARSSGSSQGEVSPNGEPTQRHLGFYPAFSKPKKKINVEGPEVTHKITQM